MNESTCVFKLSRVRCSKVSKQTFLLCEGAGSTEHNSDVFKVERDLRISRSSSSFGQAPVTLCFLRRGLKRLNISSFFQVNRFKIADDSSLQETAATLCSRWGIRENVVELFDTCCRNDMLHF